MSNEPYLILHRVRGEPAFDVAIQITCPICNKGLVDIDEVMKDCDECEGSGLWWIIPTSGHRAYPYWNMELDRVDCDDVFDAKEKVLPSDWPDHYSINNAPIKHEPQHSELLNQLGLSKASKLVRRI